MSRLSAYVIRFAISMAGYAVAVVVAVLVSVFIMLLPVALPDQDGWNFSPLRDLPDLVGYGLVITAVFAFPGFVVTLVLSNLGRWRRSLPFVAAGGIDALAALMLFGAYGGGSVTYMPVGLVVPCVPGGLAGGAAYWLTAGRFLARRRQADEN